MPRRDDASQHASSKAALTESAVISGDTSHRIPKELLVSPGASGANGVDSSPLTAVDPVRDGFYLLNTGVRLTSYADRCLIPLHDGGAGGTEREIARPSSTTSRVERLIRARVAP
jgi:hypothetical protein